MAKERKKGTPEQEKKKAEKKAQRREAKGFLREFIKTLEDGDLKVALTLIIGTGIRGRAAVPSIKTKIKEALLEAAETGISEMQMFKLFKIGQPEMARNIKSFLKGDPESRVWVQLTEEAYIIVGLGAEVPDNWEGYIPADIEQL